MADQTLVTLDSMLNLITPADGAAAVTPHDSTANAYRCLYVGGAGNVAVEMVNGDEATFVGVPAGTFMPIRVAKVKLTNTTATNIVGLN